MPKSKFYSTTHVQLPQQIKFRNCFYFLLLSISLFLSLVNPVKAEQKKTVGHFDIHYVALGSTFISPTIAQNYGIKRSRYTGLINISVLNTNKAGNPAVPVEIQGTANNLLDAKRRLDFREIREGDAIYYIAEVSYRDNQRINFNISIKYKNQLNTQLVFEQKFYTD